MAVGTWVVTVAIRRSDADFSGRWDMGCEISRGIRTGLDYGLNNGKDAFAITCIERCVGGTNVGWEKCFESVKFALPSSSVSGPAV